MSTHPCVICERMRVPTLSPLIPRASDQLAAISNEVLRPYHPTSALQHLADRQVSLFITFRHLFAEI